jgi:AcrR family transcriptional regulator
VKRTSEQAENTRGKILDAAAHVFSRTGFAASRLEDIAREAGLTRGAIYWHFENKQDLFRNLMQQRLGKISERLYSIYLSEAPPAERLRHLLLESILNLETDSEYRGGIRLALSMGLEEEKYEVMLTRRREHIQMMIDYMEKFLAECDSAGLLHPDVTPKLAARALIAWFDGIASLWLRTANEPVLSMKLDGPGLVELVLRGILKESNK